jgi:altronate dehydratase small subunit
VIDGPLHDCGRLSPVVVLIANPCPSWHFFLVSDHSQKQNMALDGLLLLDPRDNVLTVTRTVESGEELRLEDSVIRTPARLPLGHKIARRRILPGEKIIKYGVPIGSAIAEIAPGEHAHTHNLKSDYLPTYTLEGGNVFIHEHS